MDASMIVRVIRRELAITRADLAWLCELSPSTVGRIEKGELDPRWGTLTRILESTGFMLHGEHIMPTGDATASVAARLVLDCVLRDGSSIPAGPAAPTGPAALPAPGGSPALPAPAGPPALPAPTDASALPIPGGTSALPIPGGSPILPAPTGSPTLPAPDRPAELQAWWERWRRAGWLSDDPTTLQAHWLSHHASVVSRVGRAVMPHRIVGDGSRWRDLALRIDEAGFSYAVSDLATVLESPGDGIAEIPRIYVSDPAMVASVLGLEDSMPPRRGVQLVSAEWPELQDIVVGDGICFTSMGQAIMDGLTGTETEQGNARSALSILLLDRLRRG